MTGMPQARSFDVNHSSSSQFTKQETILAKVRNRLDPTGPPRMKKNPSSELSGEGQGNTVLSPYHAEPWPSQWCSLCLVSLQLGGWFQISGPCLSGKHDRRSRIQGAWSDRGGDLNMSHPAL